MNQPLKPEEQARVLIDEQLTRAGWFVCDRRDIDLVNRRGNAVREVIMAADHGRADCLLYVDRKAMDSSNPNCAETPPMGRGGDELSTFSKQRLGPVSLLLNISAGCIALGHTD